MRIRFVLLFLAILGGRAETLDRIAVSVGNRVITEADLDREIRITAFLNSTPPDFSPANKRETADRMVDQLLVRNELEASQYLQARPEDAAQALSEEQSRFADSNAFHAALAQYGISEDDLKEQLLWQRTLLRFIDIRFRPGIQVTDEEIRSYFNEHLRTIAQQSRPGENPSVDQYRDRIEQTIAGQAANSQAEEWLRQARRRTRIEYHEEAFH